MREKKTNFTSSLHFLFSTFGSLNQTVWERWLLSYLPILIKKRKKEKKERKKKSVIFAHLMSEFEDCCLEFFEIFLNICGWKKCVEMCISVFEIWKLLFGLDYQTEKT